MFVFFGCLICMPILGPLPKAAWFSAGWKVVYVIVVRFVPMPLADVLLWSGTAPYPAYEPPRVARRRGGKVTRARGADSGREAGARGRRGARRRSGEVSG
jgi:hypothetical protein